MVEDKRSGHLSTHIETSYAIHADSCHMHEHGAYYDVKRSHLQRKKEYPPTKCYERDSLYTQEFLDFGFSINLTIVSVLSFLGSGAFRQEKYKINIYILSICTYIIIYSLILTVCLINTS